MKQFIEKPREITNTPCVVTITRLMIVNRNVQIMPGPVLRKFSKFGEGVKVDWRGKDVRDFLGDKGENLSFSSEGFVFLFNESEPPMFRERWDWMVYTEEQYKEKQANTLSMENSPPYGNVLQPGCQT